MGGMLWFKVVNDFKKINKNIFDSFIREIDHLARDAQCDVVDCAGQTTALSLLCPTSFIIIISTKHDGVAPGVSSRRP